MHVYVCMYVYTYTCILLMSNSILWSHHTMLMITGILVVFILGLFIPFWYKPPFRQMFPFSWVNI